MEIGQEATGEAAIDAVTAGVAGTVALGPEIGTGTAEEVAIAWPSEGVRTAESGKSGGEKEEGAEDGTASPGEPNVQTGGVPEVARRMSVALDPAASRTDRIHGVVAAVCVAPLVLTVGTRLRTDHRMRSRRSAGAWRRSR